MPRYMLDTDTCSYIMKRSNDAVLKRLPKIPVSDVCISVVTKSELLFGVEVSPRRRQDESALNAFLRYLNTLYGLSLLATIERLSRFTRRPSTRAESIAQAEQDWIGRVRLYRNKRTGVHKRSLPK
jgi:predicted nucleic acid-binding protein